tara:strand:- start:12 stop:593 length:582 start_codon:yes stop_codon:yes gene_type:complete
MANKDAAFGLKPIGKVGQNKDAQGLSEYTIAASTSSAIYQNDPVKAASTGSIDVAAAGDALLGSLNGVFYTDSSTSKPTWANHLEASNAATDIVGFVSDDPYERFEIQCNSTFATAGVFSLADIEYTAGDSANYISKVELDRASLSLTSGQLKVIGVTKNDENNTLLNATVYNANVNLVVTVNEHFLKATTGV